MIHPDRITTPGYYHYGDGLFLQVSGKHAKSWVLRYSIGGRAREMGLGSLGWVSLIDARAAAADARKLCRKGIDPIEARKGRVDALSEVEELRAENERLRAENALLRSKPTQTYTQEDGRRALEKKLALDKSGRTDA